ncbi:MAG: helix-turn-helix domain-containing protein [Petrimonas sp.]|nr:helix-turn-helix domain-containing protein [Petrimonas sp.]
MLPEITKIRGIHPGAVLRRELKKKGLQAKQFALSLGEHPQTINAICNERRGINPTLSIKLGKALDADEAYFMQLQAFYEVKKQKYVMAKNGQKPNLLKFSNMLFWDTDMQKIDWIRQRKAVVKRVFERGNADEINEIIRFYGRETVEKELENTHSFYPVFQENVQKHLKTE